MVQVNLVTLDLANNRITRIRNVSHLTKLEEFWVSILTRCTLCVYETL